MNPQFKAAVAAVGLLAGGLVVYGLLPGADTGALGQYPLRTIVAPVRVDADPACRVFPDGGCCSTQTYRTRKLQVRMLSDGGWLDGDAGPGVYQAWQPQLPDGGLCFYPIRPDGFEWQWDDGGLPDDSHWCACRPDDGGVCNVDRPPLADGGPDLLSDGGQRRMAGPLGRLLQPGEHPAGPGCERTPCNVMAGVPSGECGLP